MPDDVANRSVYDGDRDAKRISWPIGFSAIGSKSMLVRMAEASRMSPESLGLLEDASFFINLIDSLNKL